MAAVCGFSIILKANIKAYVQNQSAYFEVTTQKVVAKPVL